MWQSSKAHPLAYCPPGRGVTLSYIPRALPPVTQSSALQAPECMWGTCDVIALQAPECMWRPIRGKEETSIGQGDFCFYSVHTGFPWRTKETGGTTCQ